MVIAVATNLNKYLGLNFNKLTASRVTSSYEPVRWKD